MHPSRTPVARCWAFVAGVLLASSLSTSAQERWQPEIPTVWDEEAIATIEVPLPSPGHSPRHVSRAYYEAIPTRAIYKSYPVYHPDHEPEGYWEWLHEVEPEVVFDPAELETKKDWIRAGELVFTEGSEYSTGIELASSRDARAYAAARIRLGEGGVFPYSRYFVREQGKVELGIDSCASCHTRVMDDGSLLFGGPGDFPLGEMVAYELGVELGEAAASLELDEDSFMYRATAAPWLENGPGAALLGRSLVEALAIWDTLPPGVQARQRSSFFSPARVPDLIGVRDRLYLDASGLMQQRSIGDLMRYAALNQGGDELSSFGGFVPASEPAAEGRELPPPTEFTRYSDEMLYALALYLEALEPPPNPNPFNAAAERGRDVFRAERCNQCHPAPLFTNNELMAVLDFEVPEEHRERYRVSGRTIDTDPGLTLHTRRGTGYYKVPSLRGLWYRGPFFHDGSLQALEDVFDPARVEEGYVPTGFRRFGVEPGPVYGHEYGLDRTEQERADLVAYLRTL